MLLFEESIIKLFSGLCGHKENTECIKLILTAALVMSTEQDSISVFINEKVLTFLLKDVGMDKLELFLISVFVRWEITVVSSMNLYIFF
jgi:hypothetical protein